METQPRLGVETDARRGLARLHRHHVCRRAALRELERASSPSSTSSSASSVSSTSSTDSGCPPTPAAKAPAAKVPVPATAKARAIGATPNARLGPDVGVKTGKMTRWARKRENRRAKKMAEQARMGVRFPSPAVPKVRPPDPGAIPPVLPAAAAMPQAIIKPCVTSLPQLRPLQCHRSHRQSLQPWPQLQQCLRGH